MNETNKLAGIELIGDGILETIGAAKGNRQQVQIEQCALSRGDAERTGGLEIHITIGAPGERLPNFKEKEHLCDTISRAHLAWRDGIKRRFLTTVAACDYVVVPFANSLRKRIPILPTLPETGAVGDMCVTVENGDLHVCIGENNWCRAWEPHGFIFAEFHRREMRQESITPANAEPAQV